MYDLMGRMKKVTE